MHYPGYKVLKVSLILLLILTFFLSLGIGRFPISPLDIIRGIFSWITGVDSGISDIARNVILKIRLPRVILALSGGIGLGVCGASLQGIFRNPLVSPGVIGVTSGSGFGASLGILIFGWGTLPMLFAFIFGIGALAITYGIAKKTSMKNVLIFILAGVVINMFFQAMISLVKFLADAEDKLPSIVYWLMGSLSTSSWKKVFLTVPLTLISSFFLILLRWRMNLLSLGFDSVRGLGMEPEKIMRWILILTTLIVSSIVSVAGIVGWIGLIIPHISRLLVGTDNKKLLPVSALTGGIFFLVIDTTARSISAMEVPLGILTAIIGAPIFIGLLLKSKGNWNI